jgi:hypothetical protein
MTNSPARALQHHLRERHAVAEHRAVLEAARARLAEDDFAEVQPLRDRGAQAVGGAPALGDRRKPGLDGLRGARRLLRGLRRVAAREY